MAEINAKDVKLLRDRTSAGMMDCKKALQESDGDMEKAVEWLRKKGLADVGRKAGRVAAEGTVGSYVHGGGKLGVLVEVNCESDFVARGQDFQDFVKEVAMHIAAANPPYLTRDEVPGDAIEKEKEIFRAQMAEQNKPANIVEKIVEGKVAKWYSEVCLMEQPWVREPKMTIEELRSQVVQKTGENVTVRRFVRFQLGEGIERKVTDLAAEVAALNAAAAK